MDKPVRIQRKRTKGYKTPPNTKYAGRPTLYGNIFKIGETVSVNWNEPSMLPFASDTKFHYGSENIFVRDAAHAVELWERWLDVCPLPKYLIAEIRGYNLSCFCPLDKPCHVDILLKLANE